MSKTIDRSVALSNIHGEAGTAMRRFLDGETFRDTLLGSLQSLYHLEIRLADIKKDKHELAAIHYLVKEHVENGEPLEVTMKYIREIFYKTNIFGNLY